ncbi:hypothetical protein HYPSUDRAFT_631779 [Hypholoma sublateritium FD-334 SS-4]|uniref:Uncharacterized protein n=1 Tax=Hypholoma sublateritium (strain FD-334 SS-4) TaxID=945553 RepID=A0A0D2QBF6_HYPSF|nr:hypothetical protein HYPSUDRAFT_631779 [Hypholoma sublateritium FD-334 SS-4]
MICARPRRPLGSNHGLRQPELKGGAAAPMSVQINISPHARATGNYLCWTTQPASERRGVITEQRSSGLRMRVGYPPPLPLPHPQAHARPSPIPPHTFPRAHTRAFARSPAAAGGHCRHPSFRLNSGHVRPGSTHAAKNMPLPIRTSPTAGQLLEGPAICLPIVRFWASAAPGICCAMRALREKRASLALGATPRAVHPCVRTLSRRAATLSLAANIARSQASLDRPEGKRTV